MKVKTLEGHVFRLVRARELSFDMYAAYTLGYELAHPCVCLFVSED